MKANELRIGSIVKSLVNDEDFSIVEEIGHKASLGYYVSLNNQHSGVWLQHQERDLILPLPLTEEWLIKFGFESFHKRDFKKKGLFITTYFATPQTLVDDDFGNKRVLELKYVHQLQNLYFALTNEELTMK
jgi:hypothetical protein